MTPKPVEKRAPKLGELVCSNCGSGNDPARRFCRACGFSLAQAQPARPLPWYRRIFSRRAKAPLAAGERTKGTTRSAEGQRRGIRLRFVLTSTLAILVLLGVAGYLVVPPFQQVANVTIRNVIEEVRKLVSPVYKAVAPKSVTASSSEPGHPVSDIDPTTNTYWSSAEAQPTLIFEYEPMINIGAMVLFAGVSGQPSDFRTPTILEITSLDTNKTVRVEVKPILDRQDHFVDLPGTTRVQVRVVSSRGSPTLPVAISSLEFNRRE